MSASTSGSPHRAQATGTSRWPLWLSGALASVVMLLVMGYGWMASDPGAAMRQLQAWSIDGPLGSPRALAAPTGEVMTWSTGSGDTPAMVLIHGFGDAGAGWTQTAELLAASAEVHILDLPGHGRSTRPEGPPRLEDLVGGLDTVATSIEGPLVLVGNSLGGWVAATWALEHPSRVARLVLVNNAGLETPLDPDVLLPVTREGVAHKNRIVMGDAAPSLPGIMLDGLIALHRDPWLQTLFNHLMQDAPKLDGRLDDFTGPVALIWGTPDEFFPADSYLARMKRERPEARVTILDGCGHAPQYSCPEQLAKAILAAPVP